MRITVFGATGRTGVPLVREALDRGHEVVAFARSTADLPVEDPALAVVEGDAYTDDGVREAVDGAGVRVDGEQVSLSGKVMGVLLRALAGSVLDDATEHVERVRATDLDWTIVRAPRLADGDGTGDYRAGDVDLGFESIARADVARFILDCVEDGRYVRELPKVGPA